MKRATISAMAARTRPTPVPALDEETKHVAEAAEAAGHATRTAARICLLGGFRLGIGGRAVPVQATAQRLLAYLALRERPVSRTTVASALWLDSTEAHAHGSLRSALWRVQRLPALLVTRAGDNLGLHPGVVVDAREMRAHARRIIDARDACAAVDVDAMVRSAGLLPGWHDDWVLMEQEQLREMRNRALESLALRLAAERQYGRAVDVALEAVHAEPLRESAHRALISVYLAEGNRAQGLAHYRRLERLLWRELRVAPSPEVRALAERALHDS